MAGRDGHALPSTRWLCSSYSASLSTRDNLKTRRLLQSPWYQKHYGQSFTLTTDQNVKTRFDNSRTGYRIATSVGGIGTGEGGNRILVDDPHNVLEGESELVRESVLSWWFETMSTRGDDPTAAVRAIIMQRVNERDLTGATLARDLGYEHLCLPMRYESTRRLFVGGHYQEVPVSELPTSIGFLDPRRIEGELLWPARFTEESVRQLESSLGSYAAAGQLQQRPAPREGGMFKREWFEGKIIHALWKTRMSGEAELPVTYQFVRYWDKAGTEGGTGARTAGALFAKSDHQPPRFVVCDVMKGRWSAGQREQVIRTTAQNDRDTYGHVIIWQEQEPGSSGKEAAESSLVNLSGFPAHKETVSGKGDKEIRAEPLATQCEARNVWLLEGQYIGEYLDELAGFPSGLKDQVDSSSGAFNKLAMRRYGAVA